MRPTRPPASPAAARLLVALLAFASACGGQPPPSPRAAGAAATPGDLGPALTLDAPARGAMLRTSGAADEAVAVRGQACDSGHAVMTLAVDGRPIPVAAPGVGCVPFELAHPGRVGLNVVHAEATNDAWQLGTLAQAFLLGPDYFSPAPGDPAARAAQGILLQVGPALLDDGDRTTPDDVASIAERLLAALDLDAAVGPARLASPDADGDGRLDTRRYACLLFSQTNARTGFEARKDGPFTHGPVTVDRLQPVGGGASVRVTVAAPRLPLAVTGNLDSGCLGAARLTVTGDASATALLLEGQVALGLDAGGAPLVSVPALSATLQGLSLDIDLGALANWTGLGSALGDALAAAVRGAVERALAGAVQQALVDRTTAALALLAGGRTAVALPAELGGATLLVDSGLDTLEFTPQGGLIGAWLHVHPETPRPEHQAAGPFGAMRLGGTGPDLGAFLAALPGAALAIAVQDDLLQQVLHAAWLAGAFDRDLSAFLGGAFPGASLTVFAGLPPVVMPKAGRAPGVELGWGEVAFELRAPGPRGMLVAQGTFSAVLPVDHLEAGAGGIDLGFGDAVEAWAQVTSVNWGPEAVAREALTAELEGALRNLLPQVLASAVRPVPLPRLDLAALDPALPALRLSLGSPRLERAGRYEVLAGAVTTVP
jgi:hypothetical protein